MFRLQAPEVESTALPAPEAVPAQEPRGISRRTVLAGGLAAVTGAFLAVGNKSSHAWADQYDEMAAFASTLQLRDVGLATPTTTLNQYFVAENPKLQQPETAKSALLITHAGFIENGLHYWKDFFTMGAEKAAKQYEHYGGRRSYFDLDNEFFEHYKTIAQDPQHFWDHNRTVAQLVGATGNMEAMLRTQYVESYSLEYKDKHLEPQSTAWLEAMGVTDTESNAALPIDMLPRSDTWVLGTGSASGTLEERISIAGTEYAQQAQLLHERLRSAGINTLFVAGEFAHNLGHVACLGQTTQELIAAGFEVRGIREAVYPSEPPTFRSYPGEMAAYKALYDNAVSVDELMDH